MVFPPYWDFSLQFISKQWNKDNDGIAESTHNNPKGSPLFSGRSFLSEHKENIDANEERTE
ncbi:enoyl-CoA hydratase/carnithine racemase [Candidatus Scalindua japonica]|uniref:Enoyl-CoA hydratase/carnithine racemase n=1 Tax=Candidatus Scalindua japonica TaxID=1284222 RepID=A0A286TY45_9BACT|nr:enoyl-CoA hydratase/carnithine racemase [Candidatus Scalindua japonica]